MARRNKGVYIEGLADLTQQLEKLQKVAMGPEIRAALLDAATTLSDEARRYAPVANKPTYREGKYNSPGTLRDSIKSALGRSHKNFLQAFSFVFSKDAFYAHIVHNGSKPHTIKAKSKKFMTVRGDFNFGFAKKVKHPGAKPQPFYTRAIRSKRTYIKNLIESKVKAAFDAIARAA
jgi:HK97 gp10 family phage protein